MPSFRHKLMKFIRQLSNPQDSQEEKPNNEDCFIQHYLSGRLSSPHRNQPAIKHGRTPQELPSYEVAILSPEVIGAMTGPEGGLTTVNKLQKTISASDPDIQFIEDEDEATLASETVINLASPGSFTRRKFVPLQKSESVPNTFHRSKRESARKINQKNVNKVEKVPYAEAVAGISNWDCPGDCAYGASTTLYERNPLTKANAGDPIADCFAVVARKNSAILALADGVNWGEKACLAAKAAIHGCVDYLNRAFFDQTMQDSFTTTDIFVSLLRSFHAAHNLILQEGGMLTTLAVVVVVPLKDSLDAEYVACSCNVGDSLAYVYSVDTGVRELTQGSHNVHAMRDMRDALGALGPVDGQNPELTNLTLAFTPVQPGDMVFVTSDGVSDNLDPVIGKFTGLMAVEAHQRHKLSLLRMEDLLKNGCSGNTPTVKNARELVSCLLDFVTGLTSAKRRLLEDTDLYAGADGKALDRAEQRNKRKDASIRLRCMPGKLDHATVAAYLVGEF